MSAQEPFCAQSVCNAALLVEHIALLQYQRNAVHLHFTAQAYAPQMVMHAAMQTQLASSADPDDPMLNDPNERANRQPVSHSIAD